MNASLFIALTILMIACGSHSFAVALAFDEVSAATTADPLAQARFLEAEKQFPQAIEGYRRYLSAHPENDEARAALARVLSWESHYRESEQLYRDILTRHPADRDVRTALARLLSWQKRYDESEHLYDEILLEAPEDPDARQGRADVLLWTNRPKEALAQYEIVFANTHDPELAKQIERVKADMTVSPMAPVGHGGRLLHLPYRDYLMVGYSHYTYTNNVPDERDFRFEGAMALGDKTLVARVEPMNRFGFHDTPVSAELYSPLWQRAWGYIGAQATINPNFAPNYSAVGELFQGLGVVHSSLSWLEVSFGYRRLLFKKDNIDLLLPGVNIYLPFNLWLTEKVYFIPDTGSITLSSQLTWRPADRIQAFVSGGFGTSGERIVATQDFTRVNSRILQGGVTFPLTEKFSGEALGFYEDRSSLYVRRGGSFNLIYHW